MSRELYESPTSAWDVEIRVRRMEERMARLEAAQARLERLLAAPARHAAGSASAEVTGTAAVIQPG
jgi:hypothetical protein